MNAIDFCRGCTVPLPYLELDKIDRYLERGTAAQERISTDLVAPRTTPRSLRSSIAILDRTAGHA